MPTTTKSETPAQSSGRKRSRSEGSDGGKAAKAKTAAAGKAGSTKAASGKGATAKAARTSAAKGSVSKANADKTASARPVSKRASSKGASSKRGSSKTAAAKKPAANRKAAGALNIEAAAGALSDVARKSAAKVTEQSPLADARRGVAAQWLPLMVAPLQAQMSFIQTVRQSVARMALASTPMAFAPPVARAMLTAMTPPILTPQALSAAGAAGNPFVGALGVMPSAAVPAAPMGSKWSTQASASAEQEALSAARFTPPPAPKRRKRASKSAQRSAARA